MTVLLDTHILLWWLAKDRALSAHASRIIRDGSNRVVVSAASAWEIAIKQALGKLSAPTSLEAAIEESDLETLPISVRHAVTAGALPKYHADPFDRMLVAQAQMEGMALLTHDHRLLAYGEFVKLV
jgi:PIN domain nuclease of toxin-antitoxin system